MGISMPKIGIALKPFFKSKFFIYTVITPAFGVNWFFMLLPIFEPMLRYSLPHTVTNALIWRVFKSLITLVLLSPLIGLLAFPVALVTYLTSNFIHKKHINKNFKFFIMIVLAMLSSAIYANIISSKASLDLFPN